MFTKNKIIGAVVVLTMCLSSVNAGELNDVKVFDKNTIGVSNTVSQISEIGNNSKIKLLEEVRIFDDLVDSSVNTVVLYLDDTLEKSDKTYSLFSATSTGAYIDFVYNTDDGIFELENTDEKSDISYISIVDGSFIELRFKNEVLENYDFSMIKEADITNISHNDDYLIMEANIDLVEAKNYLLTFIELYNNSGDILDLEESIINFTASAIPEVSELNELENTEVIIEETNNENISNEIIPEETNLQTEENMELNSAEEMNLESEQNEEGNFPVDIEQVAMDVRSTPATGAETGILILLTILFSSYIFLRKNFKA